MKAFDIKVNGKFLDYRVGTELDLDKVKVFFEQKNFGVKTIWQEKRHVVGILNQNDKEYFLKLATTLGISETTKIDWNWNEEFNKHLENNSIFCVPKNIESGYFNNDLFYIIEEYFKGEMLASSPTPKSKNESYLKHIDEIIELSEIIQEVKINPISDKDSENFTKWNIEKVKSWFIEIPLEVINKYNLRELLNIVEKEYPKLSMKTRHGDFTPWHMIKLNNKIGLIDGEHAMRNGVEYYDIAYFIQRIYSVLQNPQASNEILNKLIIKKYDLNKLKVVLASRTIGGFLDEAIISDYPNFEIANNFKNWVLNL